MNTPNNTQQLALYARDDSKPMEEIKTIMGGLSKFGTSHKSHKRHIEARQLEKLQQQG